MDTLKFTKMKIWQGLSCHNSDDNYLMWQTDKWDKNTTVVLSMCRAATCGNNNNLAQKHNRFDFRKYSFPFSQWVINDWNKLLHDVVNVETVNQLVRMHWNDIDMTFSPTASAHGNRKSSCDGSEMPKAYTKMKTLTLGQVTECKILFRLP